MTLCNSCEAKNLPELEFCSPGRFDASSPDRKSQILQLELNVANADLKVARERGDIESSRVASQRIFAFESAISKIKESVTQEDAEEDTEHELEPEGDNEDYPMHKRRKKTRGEY